MYTGTPPFEKTTPTDSYYRLIKDKNFTTFWNAHSKRKPLGFYSEDFKDLINRMLAYDPKERITLGEIAVHPWAKGVVLTPSAIKDEFIIRKSKIDQQHVKEEAEKQRKKTQKIDALNNRTAFVRSEDTDP